MRRFGTALMRLNARIEACWVGDLIGILSIMFFIFGALVMAGVTQ